MSKIVTFHRVTLNWEKAEYDKLPKEAGVYQIYGTSPIYGVDTLLYIGKSGTVDSRVAKHFDNTLGFIGRQPNKTCRFAELPKEMAIPNLTAKDFLTAIEEILIIMHKPSFNSQRLINVSVPTKNHWIYIQNHGDRGMLNLEVTNYYFMQSEKENNSNEKAPH